MPCPEPATDGKLTHDEKEWITAWDQDNVITSYILITHLPDSTTLEVSKLETALKCWTYVEQEYKTKSVYIQHNLKATFSDMQCP